MKAAFAMLLHAIWKERCTRLFDGIAKSPTFIISSACIYYGSWKEANTSPTAPNPATNTSPSWEPPGLGELKMNVDVGCIADGRTSIGVLRDRNGLWILGFLHLLPPSTVLEAEVRALLTRLQLIIQDANNNMPMLSIAPLSIHLVQLIVLPTQWPN